jgi:hypothetical protein
MIKKLSFSLDMDLVFSNIDMTKLVNMSIILFFFFGHLGIRPSGNPPQKTLISEDVGSIPEIFKIYVL